MLLTEFLKYKVEKPSAGGLSSSMTGLSRIAGGVSGMLWVHLLAGRGLRPAPSGSSPGSPPTGPLAPVQPPTAPRDLYCVLECDRVHKARTVVSAHSSTRYSYTGAIRNIYLLCKLGVLSEFINREKSHIMI